MYVICMRIYVQIYMYVMLYAHMSAYIHVYRSEVTLSCWFLEPFFLCFDTGSLIVPKSSVYARMADWEGLGICLSPPTQC